MLYLVKPEFIFFKMFKEDGKTSRDKNQITVKELKLYWQQTSQQQENPEDSGKVDAERK